MNIDNFKKDIDVLIAQFTQDESKTLADMKRVWISKKFSYIYEARPSTNLAFFMQSLYAHCIGYMVSTGSLSNRLGGLYCLYCLYETQPFKPPFKVYISVGELKNLRVLVVDAKANDIRVVSALVKRMLERNMFLFGIVDLVESSVTETVNQLQQVQNTCIQIAYKELFDKEPIENYVCMDLGMEFELNLLKKMSAEYAEAKNVAVKEASSILDVQNIKHISENKELIGDVVEKIADDWQVQKQTFYKQTGLGENDWQVQKQTFYKQTGLGENDGYVVELEQFLLQENSDDDENNQD
ncbi:uncharacterized protein LOC123881933 [Trifolium pratense]|uniref:uncharacterized protein LOC123881933 n=1 Tax=Trifolium pratense TaxID=57577 RepID=UPI001E696814|nr:uncharacterized protein LOC123881933 [Trifolium pratense]